MVLAEARQPKPELISRHRLGNFRLRSVRPIPISLPQRTVPDGSLHVILRDALAEIAQDTKAGLRAAAKKLW